MVIDYLHVLRSGRCPAETDVPLGVDADTVLTGAVTAQRLQAVARGRQQVSLFDGIVNHLQLALGNILDTSKPPGALALID